MNNSNILELLKKDLIERLKEKEIENPDVITEETFKCLNSVLEGNKDGAYWPLIWLIFSSLNKKLPQEDIDDFFMSTNVNIFNLVNVRKELKKTTGNKMAISLIPFPLTEENIPAFFDSLMRNHIEKK